MSAHRRSYRWVRRLTVVAPCAALALVACTSIVNVDRFHAAENAAGVGGASGAGGITPVGSAGGSKSGFTDLRLNFMSMKPHHKSLFEFFVIDVNNTIQCHGVVDPLGSDDVSLYVPSAVPSYGGPYRFDFYADLNSSRSFDGLGSVVSNDHAWRISPLIDYPDSSVHANGAATINFLHNTIFTNIDEWPSGTPNKAQPAGIDAHITLKNVDAFAGALAQVRVSEKSSGHVVALYRWPLLPATGDVSGVVSGVIDVGVDYLADVYVDANRDGTYQSPADGGADKGWRLRVVGADAGLELALDLTAPGGNVDVGQP